MDWILTQRMDKINGLKKMLTGNRLLKKYLGTEQRSKGKVEKPLNMTWKFVFIIRFYEMIERKIVRWRGLEAHLQK